MNGKPEAIMVFVHEIPEGMTPELAVKAEKDANEAFGGMDLPGVDRIRILYRSSDRVGELRRGFCKGQVRDATQTLLRELGLEAAAFVKHEDDYQFLWDHAIFGDQGLVHILHVIRGNRSYRGDPRELDVADGRYLVRRNTTTFDPFPTEFGDAGNWRVVSENAAAG